MADKTDTERIAYLEKRVSELQKELAEAQNPRIFDRKIIPQSFMFYNISVQIYEIFSSPVDNPRKK